MNYLNLILPKLLKQVDQYFFDLWDLIMLHHLYNNQLIQKKIFQNQ